MISSCDEKKFKLNGNKKQLPRAKKKKFVKKHPSNVTLNRGGSTREGVRRKNKGWVKGLGVQVEFDSTDRSLLWGSMRSQEGRT